MRKQKGINIVEFAIVSLLFFTLLFGIVEFARLMFIINTLGEASRRGARIAAVCPIDGNTTAQIEEVINFSTFTTAGFIDTSRNILSISDGQIEISYLDKNFGPKFIDPAGISPTDSLYNEIAFVQVKITFDPLQLAIPGVILNSIAPPSITTTLPRESLGRTSANNPTTGSVPRQCF